VEIVDVASGAAKLLLEFGRDPAWQPAAGLSIAFERRKGGAREAPEVWLVSSHGGALRKLCDGQHPSWSADGKTLYCYSQAEGGIVSVDLATSHLTPVFTTSDPLAAISPDGKRIAQYKSRRLEIDDIASGELQRALPLPNWNGVLVSWSPDGKQVAFGGGGDFGRAGLWLLDLQTGRRMLVAAGQWSLPVWSPDGSKFTFQYRGPGQRAIWIVDAQELARLKPLSDG
jgi:Tol biopolymer transport system component